MRNGKDQRPARVIDTTAISSAHQYDDAVTNSISTRGEGQVAVSKTCTIETPMILAAGISSEYFGNQIQGSFSKTEILQVEPFMPSNS